MRRRALRGALAIAILAAVYAAAGYVDRDRALLPFTFASIALSGAALGLAVATYILFGDL